MTSTDLTFLVSLCLVFSAANMGLTGDLPKSSVCEDGWIYHFDSNTCLKIGDKNENNFFSPIRVHKPCGHYQGGDYSNVSGDVVSVTNENIDVFLREYLRFLNISRAVVRSTFGENFNDHFPVNCYEKCYSTPPRDQSYKLMSLAEALGTKVRYEKLPLYYTSDVVCQVNANSEERIPPSCPQNVTVESVSDNSVTLSIKPGQIRSKVTLRFNDVTTSNTAPSSSCTKPSDRCITIFLLKPMMFKAGGLLPNTSYTIHFDVDNNNCNETIDIITEEGAIPTVNVNHNGPRTSCVSSLDDEMSEAKYVIIGLSAGLATSVCIIAVLAILFCKKTRKAERGTSVAYLNSHTGTSNEARDFTAKVLNSYSIMDGNIGTATSCRTHAPNHLTVDEDDYLTAAEMPNIYETIYANDK